MPQTEEHLAILELLGVQRGIPVIAKTDLVDREWLELVSAELVGRLARSRVRWEPPVATSAVSGAGLEELRATLARLAQGLVERPAEDLFRLPIDRVFAVAGAGTVVTGSTWSGSVGVGESVRLLPLDREARVRSIEVHGEPTQRAAPGRRTALALVGVDKHELERGHVAVTGTGWAATSVLEAAVELLPGAPRPIAARTRVRVHHGTAVVLARAMPARPIAPGERGPVRLMLETPLVARGGDRFVLRSFSPVTTIGGGIVLDPFPRQPGGAGRAGGAGRRRQPRLTADQSPAERLQLMAVDAGLQGIPLSALAVRLGVQPGRVTAVIAGTGAGLLSCGDTLAARTALTAEVTRLAEVLRRHHEEHPLDPGMSLQALRAAVVAPAPPPAVIDQILDLGTRKQAWELAGSVARVPGWQPALDARATDARALLARRLEAARWQIPTVAELVREFPDTPVRALLAHLIREGGIEQVDQERYATKPALEQFRTALDAALTELGAATPAVLRDRLGLTRKYLIPLLEWADRRGITRRSGDARTLARLTAGSGGA